MIETPYVSEHWQRQYTGYVLQCTPNASHIDMALYLYTEPLIMARMWAGVINTIKYAEADYCKLYYI